jgi:uncharacterized protein with FMN-binding domain
LTGKMSPKFVALSALAVGAIYATGYSVSATGQTALAASSSTGSNVAGGSSGQASSGSATAQSSGSSQTSTGGAAKTNHSGGQSSGNSSRSTSANTAKTSATSSNSSKSANTTQQYLDGTYSGSAANQIGAVAVNVTIQAGKIANVQITSCYTHYPQSYIDPVLPDYVVAHQTTQIPVVSGATLSTEDFYYAVVQALQSAQNPHYKG